MSVTLLVCRKVITSQYTISAIGNTKTFYVYYEVLTRGWTCGARIRSKRFSSIRLLQCYLNKLHAGHFMDDDPYDTAFNLTLDLEYDDTLSVGI